LVQVNNAVGAKTQLGSWLTAILVGFCESLFFSYCA